MTELWPAAGSGAVGELEIKKSRFLAFVRRATDIDQARELVAEIRSMHPGARHYCSAFVVSVPGAQPQLHSNDDGEPPQTAGRPILDALVGAGLTNVAAVVVRWFGGTLLGTGGLVRAYGDVTRLALAELAVVRTEPVELFRLAVPYATAGRVEAELRAQGVHIHDVAHTANGAHLTLGTSDGHEKIARCVAEVTAGEGVLEPAGQVIAEYPHQ